MKVYKVITSEQHFNHLKDISFDIQRLGSLFQNADTEITEKEFNEFNQRYIEVMEQLRAWHLESIKRIKENENARLQTDAK